MTTFAQVIRSDGVELDLALRQGGTLMEAVRDAGVDELLALCGGNLSCATCHVYFDAAHFAELPPISAEEDDLLDASTHRRPTSRLSCQIPCGGMLAGARVEIAPGD